MSTLWKAKCLLIENNKIQLQIKNVHDFYEVPNSEMFVLQVINDAVEQNSYRELQFPKGALSENISEDESLDNVFFEENWNKFIISVTKIKEQNEEEIEQLARQYLLDKNEINEDSDDWEDLLEDQMREYSYENTLEIIMTDSKYIEHLKPVIYRKKITNRPEWDSFATT